MCSSDEDTLYLAFAFAFGAGTKGFVGLPIHKVINVFNLCNNHRTALVV